MPQSESTGTVLAYFVHFLPVDEVAASVLGHHLPLGTVAATSTRALMLDEVQIALGQGPAWDAFDTRTTTRFDIDDAGQRERWPLFSSALTDLSVRTVVAVPLAIGPLELGAVSLFSAAPVELDASQLTLAADLGTLLARSVLAEARREDPRSEGAPERSTGGSDIARMARSLAEISGLAPADALLALRHYAFRTGIGLRDLPADLGLDDLDLPGDG